MMGSFASMWKIGLGTVVGVAKYASISSRESLSAILDTRVCHMFHSRACCFGAAMSAAASAIASAKTFRQKGSQSIHSRTWFSDALLASACALTLTKSKFGMETTASSTKTALDKLEPAAICLMVYEESE